MLPLKENVLAPICNILVTTACAEIPIVENVPTDSDNDFDIVADRLLPDTVKAPGAAVSTLLDEHCELFPVNDNEPADKDRFLLAISKAESPAKENIPTDSCKYLED